MKPLAESLFDTDNVTKELPMSLELIHEEILIALKKYNFEVIDWDKLCYDGYILQKPGIMDETNMPEGWFNITILTPNKLIYKENKNDEVYIGVNVCISNGDEDDHEDENKFYIKRVDTEWLSSHNKSLFPHSSTFWDRSGWKRYSSLKTNEINEKTIKTIVKYVVGLIDKTLKIMNRDRQEICDIYFERALNGGDPLMYGKKDWVWYLEKMKKELR